MDLKRADVGECLASLERAIGSQGLLGDGFPRALSFARIDPRLGLRELGIQPKCVVVGAGQLDGATEVVARGHKCGKGTRPLRGAQVCAECALAQTSRVEVVRQLLRTGALARLQRKPDGAVPVATFGFEQVRKDTLSRQGVTERE